MTKILLVEDDKSLREIYGVRLLAEGYDIVSAGDGEEALAMAVKELPNLIISDVMMPRVSGFDMLDILRANPPTRGIKVIMMTALSSEDQRKRGEQLGADRYLVKSQVGIEDVVKTVHEVLGDGHLTAEQRIADKNAPSQEESTPTVEQSTPAPQPIARPAAPQPVQMPQLTPQPIPQSESAAPVQAPQAPVQPQPAAPAQNNIDFSQQNFSAPRASAPQSVREVPTLSNLNRPAPQPIARPATPQPAQMPQPTPQPVPQPAPVAPVQVPQTPVQSQPAAPAQFVPDQHEAVQYAQAPQSALPQPTAPFSTDRPAGLGERVIQPPVQSPESEAREAQFAAEIENVLGGFSQQSTSVNIPVSEEFSQPPAQQDSSEQPQFGAR